MWIYCFKYGILVLCIVLAVFVQSLISRLSAWKFIVNIPEYILCLVYSESFQLPHNLQRACQSAGWSKARWRGKTSRVSTFLQRRLRQKWSDSERTSPCFLIQRTMLILIPKYLERANLMASSYSEMALVTDLAGLS